jgi:hypothetical protein
MDQPINTTAVSSKSKNLRPFILLIVGLLIGTILGYSSNYLLSINNPSPNILPNQNSQSFIFQTTSVNGVITAVTPKSITLKNTQTNQSQAFPYNDHLMITTLSKDNKPATPSSNLKSIELNKDVLVNLAYEEGRYVINYIYFTPPQQSLPPLPVINNSISPNYGQKP